MKTKENTMRWLGLALACGAITLANPAQAGKPVKPPPPEPGLTFTLIDAGSLSSSGGPVLVSDMNNAGVVVGTSSAPGVVEAPFVLQPVQTATGLSYFADANSDGINDRMQALPTIGARNVCRAVAVNSSNQIVGCHWNEDLSDWQGILWIDGNASLTIGLGCPTDINDDGVVTGYSHHDLLGGGFDEAFVLVPEDQDNDGNPDTWFVDADADGVNDLIFPIAGNYPAYQGTAVLADMRVVIMDLYNSGNAAIVLPDFTDPDGDGNPWFADANFDLYTDLAVALAPVSATTAEKATSDSFLVGRVSGVAAVWDVQSAVPWYTTLPNLSSKTTGSYAFDANDAKWVIGNSYEGRAGAKAVLWKDGAVTEFSTMMTNNAVLSPHPATINAAGIVAGMGTTSDGRSTVFVAIPSETP